MSTSSARLITIALAVAVLMPVARNRAEELNSGDIGRVQLADGLLPLPPAPDVSSPETVDPDDEALPPLDEELRLHGGSYLYESVFESTPESSHLQDSFGNHHSQLLRLPESWQKPEPLLTDFQQFEGADEIRSWPGLKWFGEDGFQWEPRFVAHGSYEVFGMLLEQGGTRQDGIGHHLLLDLDLRITGTERAHLQFRPLGRENTGGSFFQLNETSRYEDNSTLIPDRWWIEGEFYSLFAAVLGDEFTPRDYHVTVGKVPYAIHNQLLINDDVTGVIVNKNTLIIPPLSNLNVQGFYFFDDVNTATPQSTELVGIHAAADWRHALIEGTVAYVSHSGSHAYDSRYAAISATQFFGPLTLAGRALFKGGDDAGRGDGALFVAESNFTRASSEAFACATGIETTVFYANFFKATSGWSPISGANFDRLRSNFSVDPLVRIGRGFNPSDTVGVSLGAELFRHHEDEQFIPELSYEQTQGEPVWGVGLRWLRKIGPQVYVDASGVVTWSDLEAFDREGIFVSTFVVF